MNTDQFIAKWENNALSERSASQSHFLDLCRLLGHPGPADSDPTGESFTFEKGAAKQDGGDGWADLTDEQFLERLLKLNLERAGANETVS